MIDTTDGVFVGAPGPAHVTEGRRRRLHEVVAFDFDDLGEFFGVIVNYATYPEPETRKPRWVVQPIRGFLLELFSSEGLKLGPQVDRAYCYGNLLAGRFPNGQVVHHIADDKLRKLPASFARRHAAWLAEFRIHEGYRRT